MKSTVSELDLSVRTPGELFWVGLQPFLLSRGYRLRPRLDPDWKPSWGLGPVPHSKYYADQDYCGGPIIDAVRITDSKKVVLKKVKTDTEEIPISLFLNSPKLRQDSRNSIVPILDVIPIPADDEWALLVMPLLLDCWSLPFRRVGEACEAFLQFLQGLELMHEHNIAHRDACTFNLMMDASRVVPRGFHFGVLSHDGSEQDTFEWRERWKVRPVKYHIIDFDISARYCSKDALMIGLWGQDRTVPECARAMPYNPFKLDIYQLGNVILQTAERYKGLKIFEDLGRKMTTSNPEERPTASEAVQMCKDIISKLNFLSIRRRIWRKSSYDDSEPGWLDKFIIQCFGWNPTY